MYDVAAVRIHFPALAAGTPTSTGLVAPRRRDVVADAVRARCSSPVCQPGQVTDAERRADRIVVDARRAMADLLDVNPAGIVFGRSMTQLT